MRGEQVRSRWIRHHMRWSILALAISGAIIMALWPRPSGKGQLTLDRIHKMEGGYRLTLTMINDSSKAIYYLESDNGLGVNVMGVVDYVAAGEVYGPLEFTCGTGASFGKLPPGQSIQGTVWIKDSLEGRRILLSGEGHFSDRNWWEPFVERAPDWVGKMVNRNADPFASLGRSGKPADTDYGPVIVGQWEPLLAGEP